MPQKCEVSNRTSRLRYGRLAITLILTLLIHSGCGESEESLERPEPSGNAPKSASGAPLVLDPAQLRIDALTQHPNPIVSNNAKRVSQSFKMYNYHEAAVGLATIASLDLEPRYQSIVKTAIAELMKAATLAAENGDQNAQYALDYFKSLTHR